ncbi:MAG: aldose epimerase family protein [Myxococcota bacterium]
MSARPVPVTRHRLVNDEGWTLDLLDLGATVQSLRVPDREGSLADVVLGFDDPADYEGRHPYLGAFVGRSANRIAGAAFVLDGRRVELVPNERGNQLHGGPDGFHRRRFEAERLPRPEGPALRFSLTSPAGDQGFPGELQVVVEYTLLRDGLRMEVGARTDAPTLFNPTQHSYFNLAGAGDIAGHELQIDAEEYTPVGPGRIPTGERLPVAGSSLDFREPRRVGDRLGMPDLAATNGYDHNFILHGEGLRRVAQLRDPGSGRILEVETDRPGLQLYTGNGFDGTLIGKGGRPIPHRGGLCLETQLWPDAPNQPGFPSAVLRPGQEFHSVTLYRFRAE